jgi:hypothetical protein
MKPKDSLGIEVAPDLLSTTDCEHIRARGRKEI